METIGMHTTADLFFQIRWSSPEVHHTDAYAGRQVNLWRDMMPGPLYNDLLGKAPGDVVQLELEADQLMDSSDGRDLKTITRHQFDIKRIGMEHLQPRTGRFYPKGLLKDLPGIYPANRSPFRILQVEKDSLGIDLGHPLSSTDIELNVTVGDVRLKYAERGGAMQNWGDLITRGVGMQARWKDKPTDFFTDTSNRRLDESPDMLFYGKPRLTQHIDDYAMNCVEQIQARFVQAGMSVLDLMSSWQTHLPTKINVKALTGLGLNETELKQNKRLNSYCIYDLNANPDLPFKEQTFDTVLCSLSIEYLTQPLEVFTEVARVLKPGGYFVVTFSNRWFEPKTIRLWTELHEFERMGLVLEYFRHDGLYGDLNTYSVRGIARPANDKYYGRLPYSDPVYAVWGRRR